jgi:hypothetical protein
MAFGNNSTSQDGLLKERYPQDKLEIILLTEAPTLGIIPKNEKLTGREIDIALVVGAGQGRSATFTTAQTHASRVGEIPIQFKIPFVENHEVANISAKLIKQTKNNDGAFMDAASLIVDNQIENFDGDIALSIFKSSAGDRAQVGSIGNGLTTNSRITLLNTKDIINFEVGMQLDAAAAQSTGGLRAYGSNGHGLYVIAVDYDAGTFDVGTTPSPTGTAVAATDAADGIPALAANDFLYCSGDRNLKMNGFADWLPVSLASNDSFFGVNRNINRVRLAGHYLDARGLGSKQSILEVAAARVGLHGGRLTHFVVNPLWFQDLSIELGTRRVDTMVKSTNASVGYVGIEVMTLKGPVAVLPDPHCPSDSVYGINKDSWMLGSVDPIVHVWEDDDQKWLRATSDAGMEIRLYSYGNLICKNPRNNIRVQVMPS